MDSRLNETDVTGYVQDLLLETQDVEALVASGAVQGARAGTLFIDMSTIAPGAARRDTARFRADSIAFARDTVTRRMIYVSLAADPGRPLSEIDSCLTRRFKAASASYASESSRWFVPPPDTQVWSGVRADSVVPAAAYGRASSTSAAVPLALSLAPALRPLLSR
mgnify:CR=1 FL=1